MRIDLASPPFAGHLHPILGLARMLQPHYEIRILTTRSAIPVVDAAGVPGIIMLDGCDDRVSAVANTAAAVRLNPLMMLRQAADALDLQVQLRRELGALYEMSRPELLIADFTLPAAGAVAHRYSIPWWTCLPSPCVLEGGNGPPAYFGGLKPSTGLVGRTRDQTGRFLTRLFKLFAARIFRRRLRLIGLRGIYRADGSEASYSNRRILAFGSQRLEFRSNWPDYLRLLPLPLYTPTTADHAPPFIDGRRHVLVTLGTHLKYAKNNMVIAVRKLAAAVPELEFHFTDGSIEGTPVVTESNFSRLAYINYQKYLCRYALVVHHGGTGIMYHTLASGCPAVVYPVDYDQFDNAARLEYAGLALRLRALSHLESVIRTALDDYLLLRRCRQFAFDCRQDSSREFLNDVEACLCH